MTTKVKAGAAKSANKRSTKPSSSGSSSKNKKKPSTPATQHRPKPSSATTKKKLPPHKRYTEAQLKVPQLNGIRPAGVQKLPNKKKGKVFVDDGDGMRTIMAMVMAEKEGNIESKMQRARQMEEIREAKRVEAEKKAQSKKEGLEERKSEIKRGKKRVRKVEDDDVDVARSEKKERRPKKRVSFG